MNEIDSWSIQKSSSLYGVENWGDEYFSINSSGNAAVSPQGKSGPSVDLYKLVKAAADKDIKLPILFRFNDILRHRVRRIHSAFKKAMEDENYQGSYLPAFPIKVNQQRHVVDVLRKAGSEFSICLLYTSPSPRDATLSRMPSSA